MFAELARVGVVTMRHSIDPECFGDLGRTLLSSTNHRSIREDQVKLCGHICLAIHISDGYILCQMLIKKF